MVGGVGGGRGKQWGWLEMMRRITGTKSLFGCPGVRKEVRKWVRKLRCIFSEGEIGKEGFKGFRKAFEKIGFVHRRVHSLVNCKKVIRRLLGY